MRWKIAEFLNRYADTCWEDLAIWAIYPKHHAFSEIFSMRHRAGGCDDMPYCGKCDQTIEIDGVRQWRK